MLSCRDLVRLISDYAGGEMDSLAKKEFETHLATCHKCRVMVRTMRQTILLCRKLDPIQMPPELHRKLRITIKERWKKKQISARAPTPRPRERRGREVSRMAMRRHHPLAEWARIDDAVDRFFRRSFYDFFPRKAGGAWPPEMMWTPVVDLLDKKDHLLLRADLPGIKKEDVKISISGGNLLTISGEAARLEEEKREDYYRCERYSGGFTRTVQLPTEVIAERVEATLRDGILEVKLPKREVKKTKELEIEVK